MTNKVRLWEVSHGQQPVEIDDEEISEEKLLESWLENDISMLDPDLLVVGRQVLADFRKRIDLLCLDSAGNVVVVELKKGQAPRDVTAQALDYASWVQDLTDDQIREKADGYFGKNSSSLEDKFREQFGEDLPHPLNSGHRSIIVAESMDPPTERIVAYLSNMGVPINVATVQHFATADGRKFLAQVFLREPAVAAAKEQSNHRKRQLTVSEMSDLADEKGISALYQQFRQKAIAIMQATVWGLKGCAFQIKEDKSRLMAVRLDLAASNAESGMQFQLQGKRLVDHFSISQENLDANMPASTSSNRDGDWSHSGYFKTTEEIDKFINILQKPSAPPGAPPSANTD